MRVKCPNCPNVVLEFDKLLDPEQVMTIRCGHCGMYASQFGDQLGVTYHSYYLATIQRLRDETKEARKRLEYSPKRRNRTSKKGRNFEIRKTDLQLPEIPKPSTG